MQRLTKMRTESFVASAHCLLSRWCPVPLIRTSAEEAAGAEEVSPTWRFCKQIWPLSPCNFNSLGCSALTELRLTLFSNVRERSMPYTSGSGDGSGQCDQSESSYMIAVASGYEVLPRNDPEAIMRHLAEVGPLSVSVDASNWSGYQGGVFDGCNYEDGVVLNHAVQVFSSK